MDSGIGRECPVPTGTEFVSTNINGTEVDFYVDGQNTWYVEAQTCRHAWSGSTLTCSSMSSTTNNGWIALSPSYSTLSGGSVYDYRYYHVEYTEETYTTFMGTYTTNSDS